MSMVIAPYWFTAGGVFSPLDLSPALWVDPSDASTVTISGSSGAYIGAAGLVVPTTQNYATANFVSAYGITGDIDIIVKATATTWAPTGGANDADLLARVGGNPYTFQIASASAVGTGKLRFVWYQGGSVKVALSTVGTGFSGGTTNWVRVTLDVNNGAGGYDCKFWTSADGSSWTQLGATVTVGSTTSIDAGSTALLVGMISTTAGEFRGTIHRSIIKNGIDGTTVFDADFENATPFVSAFTESALGAPVYVVSSTATSATANYSYIGPTGYTLSGASSNYAEAPDSASLDITGDIDLIAKVTCPSWASSLMYVFSKWASMTGYGLRIAATGELALLYGVSADLIATSTAATGFSAGSTNWIRATRVSSTGVVTFYTSSDGSSWTQLGSTVAGTSGAMGANTAALRVGALNSGTLPFAGTIHRVIVKDGIGGTTVFDADFATAPDYAASFTESSSNAATVTITATNTPANAAGALVSQINDKSGNSRHLSQGTAANMPKYWNGRNGNNCLVFDGTSDLMDFDAGSDALAFGSGWVAFTAARNGDTLPLGGTEYRRLLSMRRSSTATADDAAPNAIPFYLHATPGHLAAASAGSFTALSGSIVGNTWLQGTSVQESTNLRTRRDGTASANTAVSASGDARYLRLGASCSASSNPPTVTAVQTWMGEIGETVLVLGSVADPTTCEDYLSTKWGTP